jgi:hypothetical protein
MSSLVTQERMTIDVPKPNHGISKASEGFKGGIICMAWDRMFTFENLSEKSEEISPVQFAQDTAPVNF